MLKLVSHVILSSVVMMTAACGGVDGAADTDAELQAISSELSAELNQQFAAVRRGTAKYHRLEAALADGFVDTGLPCFDGQGYHYILPERVGTYDPAAPAILVYSPDGRLVATEWATPVDSVGGVRPVMFGETFHGPVLDPPLFVLHTWVWYHNPDGIFADRNPRITCP